MNGTFSFLLLAGVLASPGDTLVEVHEGDRLTLRDFAGVVYVQTWERPVLRVEPEDKESVPLRIVRSGNNLELRVMDRGDRNRGEDLRLTMPPWMKLEISGQDVEVEVRGLDGDLTIRNFRGDLLLRELGGHVKAHTVEGSIEASYLTGSAQLRTGDDELSVANSSASLELETVAGEILLEGVDARRISAKTTAGEIEFFGRIQEGGDYVFFSHGGDIHLRLTPPVNLTATILAYQGEFESDFPVRAKGFRSGEGLDFTIGTGGARLVMETFDGEIQLLRGSEGGAPQDQRRDELQASRTQGVTDSMREEL